MFRNFKKIRTIKKIISIFSILVGVLLIVGGMVSPFTNAEEIFETDGEAVLDNEGNFWIWQSEIIGDIAYLLGDFALQIYDISNLSNPVRLSVISIKYWVIKSFFLEKDLVFITNPVQGLLIYNISDLSNPIFLSEYPWDDRQILDVHVSNNLAYIACGSHGLLILDVTNASDPVLINTYNEITTYITDVFVHEDVAILWDLSSFIFVNISDPLHPEKLGDYHWGTYIHDVYLDQDKIYFIASSNSEFISTLNILNISSPTNPTLISQVGLQNHLLELQFQENHIYLKTYSDELFTYDVSNPFKPISVGQFYPITDGETDRPEIAFIIINENLTLQFLSHPYRRSGVNYSNNVDLRTLYFIDTTQTTTTFTDYGLNLMKNLIIAGVVLSVSVVIFHYIERIPYVNKIYYGLKKGIIWFINIKEPIKPLNYEDPFFHHPERG